MKTNKIMKKYPKLTKEIFDLPNCPEWAKYAAVDDNGECYVYSKRPYIYDDTFCKIDGIYVGMGYYDNSDWENSLVLKAGVAEEEAAAAQRNRKLIRQEQALVWGRCGNNNVMKDSASFLAICAVSAVVTVIIISLWEWVMK